jgi:hypothetical protein
MDVRRGVGGRRGRAILLSSIASGVAVTVIVALAVVPGLASAHGAVGSRFDAPLPLPLLFLGAGATVALTALWLAVSDRPPLSVDPHRERDAGGRRAGGRRLLSIPARVAVPLRRGIVAVFLLGVLAAVVSGISGRQVAAENVATIFTWPVWFHGLALLAVLVGSPWNALSPWRAAYRGLRRLEGGSIALRAYPATLGAWPGLVAFLLLIGIGENLTTLPRSPSLTTAVLGAYALATIGGAVLFGPGWLRRADPLAILYRLLGRVSVVRFREADGGDYELAARPPWRGCLDPVGGASLVAFVVAAVYTVSFDGFTETRAFRDLLPPIRDGLGLGESAGVVLYLAGFGAFLVVYALASRGAERLGGGSGADWVGASRAFAPTVLPIAAAYEVAHSYPYVLRNLGRLLTMTARPVAPGASPIDPLAGLPVSWFWTSQAVLIVLGHVVAVVAVHLVASERYGSARRARRGHLPFVVLMVGYTVLSLWIVSQPVVASQ